MSRNIFTIVVLAVLQFALPWAARADIYSPTQTELNSVEFIDFWAGNGASLDAKEFVSHPDGFNGVKFTFDTGYSAPDPDDFSRTQFEAPFTQDLTGFDGFAIDFLANASDNPLQAQIYLRWAGGGFASNGGGVNINTDNKVTATIPIGAIPVASRNQITAFGIEIFSQNLFIGETDAMASAFTAPQPPEFTETVLFGFEGTGGAGSIDGWGHGEHPDHIAHEVTVFGATEGTHALKITRQRDGQIAGPAGTSFRWGSQVSLNANSGGENPDGDYNDNGTVDAADYTRWRNARNTNVTLPNDPSPGIVNDDDFDTWKTNFGQTGGGADPAVQQRIEDIVDAINGGEQLAIDFSFENVDQFPGDQPGFLGYHLAITDGSGGFWQSDQFGFPPVPAVGTAYEGLTLTVPLSSFTDRRAQNPVGDLSTGVLTAENGQFNMILATNTGATTGDNLDVSQYTIDISVDNIRVLTLVPQTPGLAAAAPEPTSAAMALLAALGVAVGVRRRAG